MTFKEKTKNYIKAIPKYFWVLAVLTALSQFTTYYLPRVLHPAKLTLLTSKIDDSIPFIPGFIYIYVGAFVFWIVSFIYLYLKNKALAYRLFTADCICKFVCTFFFCFYPCTMNQPADSEITGFGAWLVRVIYASDEPTQLLPSMHCYMSVLLALPLFSKRAEPVPMWAKIFSPIYALLVCASTMFVKQHVFADVWTGILLAFIGWFASLGIWKLVDAHRQNKITNRI